MIYGFTPLPGHRLRRWTFCRATFTLISLTGTTHDGHAEPVNVPDLVPPGSLILNRPHPDERQLSHTQR
ncbi:hypothetical protein ACFPFX_29105 [Streptomyces mauvecolor]|uniref:Secreted protein n=1 Tax=Streptomyces mauvecolor TaxID=58345 RepID=A0ABV9UW34_9ACTN